MAADPLNFLLHRHLAAIELGSDRAGVGAMLPDLWRLVDRRVRARPLDGAVRFAAGRDHPPDGAAAVGASAAGEHGKRAAHLAAASGEHGERAAHVDDAAGEHGHGADPVGDDDEALADVVAGVEHHLDVDAWFHATAVFAAGERRTAAALRALPLGVPRMALLAHVTYELLLDGALVARVGADAVRAPLADARASLAATAALARAADLYHFARAARPAVERAACLARTDHLLDELASGDWVAGYADPAALVEMLSRIRRRLGLAPIETPSDRRRLAAALADLLAGASDDVAELLALRGV